MSLQQNQSKQSSKQTEQSDIYDLILEDHKPLKKLIEVMKESENSIEERKAAFEEFCVALVAHAKPEEEVLYTFMKEDSEMREEALEGDVEHGLADQMLEEAKRTDDEDLWSAKVKVLAELVEHHIEEEEEELLPDFKQNSTKEDRQELGEKFLAKKLDYLAAGGENVIPDPKTEAMEKNRQH